LTLLRFRVVCVFWLYCDFELYVCFYFIAIS